MTNVDGDSLPFPEDREALHTFVQALLREREQQERQSEEQQRQIEEQQRQAAQLQTEILRLQVELERYKRWY